MDQVLLVVFGTVALLARAGQAVYAAGLSRSKNSASAIIRALCDASVALLAFWAVGAAILFQQHNAVFAFHRTLFFGWEGVDASVYFFAIVATLATGVVAGTLGERSRFRAVGIASAVLAGLVFPLVGNWIWHGWLDRIGFIDGAWASAVHVTAGIFALGGAIAVGPRTGKYNRDQSTNMIPGHSVPLAGVGVLLIAVGWTPYICGWTLTGDVEIGHVAFNTLLALAGGAVGAMALGQLRYGKPDVALTFLGVLGALVAISAGALTVSTPAAVLIGLVAGALAPTAAVMLDLTWRVDDPTGGVAIHAVGGAWGVLAAGLFHPAPSVGLYFKQLGVQVLGLIAVAVAAGALSAATWIAAKTLTVLRAKEADEFDGLDLAEHDIGAYPDFQQTMIKSYHLREA